MQVVGEVLEGIPFVGDRERVARGAEALGDTGERGVGDIDPRRLLSPMDDELAADHLDIRVVGTLVPLAVVAEGVGRAVHPHEALAAPDRIVEGLLAVGRDRRVLVVAGRRQVSGGLEDERVPLADLVGFKQSAVLGCDDLESVLLADLGQDPFGQSRLVAFAGDHRMLEARALGEEQDLLAGSLGLGQQAVDRPGAQPGRARGQQPLTTIQVTRHRFESPSRVMIVHSWITCRSSSFTRARWYERNQGERSEPRIGRDSVNSVLAFRLRTCIETINVGDS